MTPTERAAVVAETEAAIVAWLREKEARRNDGPLGIPHWAYREIANHVERGEYRGVK